MTASVRASDPVEVVFTKTEAGWIGFHIPSLSPHQRFSATHLDDPFGDLLLWLEAIVDGAEVARWCVNEEGSVAQLVFLRNVDRITTRATGRLLLILSGEDRDYALSARPVTAEGLVQDVYQGFRRFAESPRYRPEEWEWRWWLDCDWEERDCDLHAWRGDPLRTLRSAKVEAFLRDGPAQPELPLRWSWEKG